MRRMRKILRKEVLSKPAACGLILVLAYFTAAAFLRLIGFAQGMGPGELQDAGMYSNLGMQAGFILIYCFVALVYFYFNRLKASVRVIYLLLAFIFAVLFNTGFCLQASKSAVFALPISAINNVIFVLFPIGCFFYSAIVIMDCHMDLVQTIENRKPEAASAKHAQLYAALFLLIAWIPVIVCTFPGSVCFDSLSSLVQMWGLQNFSNNNPIFDTVVFGIVYRIGEIIGRSDNAGVAGIVFFQLILFAFSFSYCAETVYLITRSRKLEFLLLIFYAVNPMFGTAIQVVLKDSLHLTFVVFYVCLLLRMVYSTENSFSWVLFSAAFLLAAFTRKAAIAYVAAGAAALLYLKRKNKEYAKRLLVCIFVCIGFFLCVEKILLPGLKVEPALRRERFVFPIQSICYVAKCHYSELPAEDLEVIDQMFGLENIINQYNPDLADPMKVVFRGSGRGLLRVYISLVTQYPLDCLKGFFISIWKYFFPFSPGNGYFHIYITDFSEAGRDVYYAFPSLMEGCKNYVASWAKYPLSSLFIGPGLYSWIFLFAAARAILKNRKEFVVIICPVGILLIGFVFTPVNGEVRYAYPLIAMAPLLLALVTAPSQNYEAVPHTTERAQTSHACRGGQCDRTQ